MTPASASRDAGTGERDWPSARLAWTTLSIVLIGVVCSFTDRQLLSLVIDPVRADLATSDFQAGILQGLAFSLVYALAAIPMGRLADRWSRRNLLIAGITLWSIATVGCGFAPSFAAMVVTRALVGLGEATVAPVAVSMIADLFPPRRRGLATGALLMAMMVGLGSALTIGGLILAYAQGGGFASIPVVGALAPWRQMFVVAGACGAIVVLLLTLVPEPARRNAVADGAGNPGIRTILRYPATLLVVVAAAMCAIGDYTIMAWVPALLIRKFGMSAPEIGASLGLAVIVAAVASPLIMGVIGDRVMKGSLSARFLLSATLMTLATGIFLLGVTDRADVVIFLSGAWMFCSVAALSSAMTAMQEITPSRLRGTASALIAFGSAVVGLGIGTAIVGALSDHVFTGPGAIGTSVAVTSAFAAVSAAALFWKLWFDERRGRIASLEAH